MAMTPAAAKPSLTDQEQKVVHSIKRIGATSAEKAKGAEEIMREGRFPKGQLMGWIKSIEDKGYISKVQRGKSAAYFLL